MLWTIKSYRDEIQAACYLCGISMGAYAKSKGEGMVEGPELDSLRKNACEARKEYSNLFTSGTYRFPGSDDVREELSGRCESCKLNFSLEGD